MKNPAFLVLALLAIPFACAEAAPRLSEVGPVEILRQKCQKFGEQITCQVETSMDLGGSSYKLTITNDAHAMRPILQLLPLAQQNQISVYFRAKDLRQTSDEVTQGKFEAVLVQPWND